MKKEKEKERIMMKLEGKEGERKGEMRKERMRDAIKELIQG
jgi:hypothetical protein